MNLNYIQAQDWWVFDDRLNPDHQVLTSSLNYQDAMVRWVADLNDQTPRGLVHFYPTAQPLIMLGRKDTRLPQFSEGLDHLRQAGYQVTIRPHGGLGIVCDPGILNLALVTDQRVAELSISEAYEQMVAWVAAALQPLGLTVQSYEIPDSYCPGTYDLVVQGQKIGGIAQRRFKTGVTTAAYISANGDQEKRAQVMRDFYRLGQADASYPQVDPKVMTTLADFLGEDYTIDQLQSQLLATLSQEAGAPIQPGDFQDPQLQTLYHQMQARNAPGQSLEP